MKNPKRPQDQMLTAIIVGALAGAAWDYFGAVWQDNGEINDEAALSAFIFGACVVSFLGGACALAADGLDLWTAKTPRGHKGKASWATWKDLRKDILRHGHSPYWGVFASKGRGRGQPIFSDYKSNALTIGTAGSGKGVGVVIPNALAIHESKFIPDFKNALGAMLTKPLTRRGEIVRCLDLSGANAQSDCYNPLEAIIAPNFEKKNGLHTVVSDCAEMALQLYPEPSQTVDDKFWRDGSRDLIAFAIRQMVLVNGKEATLGDVNLLLNDREQLLKDCLWAAGRLEDAHGEKLPAMPLEHAAWAECHAPEAVKNFITYHRVHAAGTANLLGVKDSKTADSYLAGAKQALDVFNITSSAHKVMSCSTFHFSDMKDGDKPTTVILGLDASRLGTQSKIAGLMQWCAMTELKRHPNKTRPVYVLHDETTNFKLHDLPSLQTWGREYGIRWHGFIQSIAAYEAVYGKQAVSTLLSETEIKQFLPNQRDPDTLALIEKMLGQSAYIGKSQSGNRDRFGVGGFNLQEDGKPLMSADEIRRTDKTILFIRGNKPVLTTLPSIAEIAPWRKQIGINPFYGKRHLLPVRLRIGTRKGRWIRRFFTLFRSKGGRP